MPTSFSYFLLCVTIFPNTLTGEGMRVTRNSFQSILNQTLRRATSSYLWRWSMITTSTRPRSFHLPLHVQQKCEERWEGEGRMTKSNRKEYWDQWNVAIQKENMETFSRKTEKNITHTHHKYTSIKHTHTLHKYMHEKRTYITNTHTKLHTNRHTVWTRYNRTDETTEWCHSIRPKEPVHELKRHSIRKMMGKWRTFRVLSMKKAL